VLVVQLLEFGNNIGLGNTGHWSGLFFVMQ
jgi:hypothetical protein